jgi:hypothetical protein
MPIELVCLSSYSLGVYLRPDPIQTTRLPDMRLKMSTMMARTRRI